MHRLPRGRRPRRQVAAEGLPYAESCVARRLQTTCARHHELVTQYLDRETDSWATTAAAWASRLDPGRWSEWPIGHRSSPTRTWRRDLDPRHRHRGRPRSAVYRALVEPHAVARWRVPDGMSSLVHQFDVREGGRFRVCLTYDAPDPVGKTTRHTDTYHGHFATLVPDRQVVETVEFETADPSLQGVMTLKSVFRILIGVSPGWACVRSSRCGHGCCPRGSAPVRDRSDR